MLYETRKHDGSRPSGGVNTFRNLRAVASADGITLARFTEAEKRGQIARLRAFQARHADASAAALRQLKATTLQGGNVFAELMSAVRCCSLGQITDALFEVGREYRRNR
jgi:methylmalonyl-CoA mutase